MSTTEDNRQLITAIFADLQHGKPNAFIDALADDVRWTTPGRSVWARTFTGKAALLDGLLGPVRAQLVERVRLTLRRIVADGDWVVVEATGKATTKAGKDYNNDYCFVYRMAGGKIAEVIEYLDTELASAVLTPPFAAASPA